MWRPQVAALRQHFRVLRYDTRGHGSSSVPAGPYTLEQLGTDVIALLDALGVERAFYCGLSMGGATGVWLGTHAPHRFFRFAICGALPWLGPPQPMNARIEAVRRDGLAPLVDATLERWFTPEFRAQHAATLREISSTFMATAVEGYVACCEALRDYDERSSLHRISRPTLIVAGTHDPSPSLAAIREFAGQVPGATWVELPAAHLSNLGAAAQFNAQVLQFFRAERSEW
jgi:3-oxoadipate enol-lactonase